VLFGQLSDTYPVAGRHRVPYIWFGALLFCTLAVLSVPLIFQVGRLLDTGGGSLVAAIAALCGLFAAYGLAISMASTPYLALLIDSTDEEERPRAVGIIWCLLTVGIVVGAISIAIALGKLDGVTDPAVLQPVLLRFMVRVAVVVLVLTVIATLGIERPRTGSSLANQEAPPTRDDAITLRQSWALVTSSRQVMVFFLFLLLFTLGLFLQDPVLESYGAEVFGMSIAATASCVSVWIVRISAAICLVAPAERSANRCTSSATIVKGVNGPRSHWSRQTLSMAPRCGVACAWSFSSW
jgi:BCD family chlorophyll transporter-like MFS transporter